MNFINSIAKKSNFAFFLRIFDDFFSGFRAKFQKIVTCVAFSIKFAKTNQKFAENSEFCEKKFTIIVNYSLHSLITDVIPYLLQLNNLDNAPLAAVQPVRNFGMEILDVLSVSHATFTGKQTQ